MQPRRVPPLSPIAPLPLLRARPRSLMPLLLGVVLPAALVLATGCVTVRPPAPSGVPGTAASSPAVRQPAPVGWPLGPLPEVGATPTPAPDGPAGTAAPAGRAVPVAAPERRAPRRAVDRPPRRAAPERPVRPPKAVRRAPAPAPKARQRQLPPRQGPVPQRTFDMAPLCAAARGRVDPSIVALCR
ncbi:hypothetical protein AB0D46_19975 [Streptomyces sp. NPDC048383]|uniref:hypothetical protein n=1 Tax=Streptomyces sp. NPDC048383 TaxID=3155386 RepID=UPI003412F99D